MARPGIVCHLSFCIAVNNTLRGCRHIHKVNGRLVIFLCIPMIGSINRYGYLLQRKEGFYLFPDLGDGQCSAIKQIAFRLTDLNKCIQKFLPLQFLDFREG